MTIVYDLPKPDDSALKRSLLLTAHLKQQMQNQGEISFAEFMEAALYHPTWGYYNAPLFELGKAGDFITAPLISPLFAQCFARQTLQFFDEQDLKSILEIGAGTGHFACELMRELEALNHLPEHYYIYERSANLQKKQQAFLQTVIPHLINRIHWLSQLPQNFVGIILANEVLDAIPVHCFYVDTKEIKERSVTFKNNQFVWQFTKPSSPTLVESAARIVKEYKLKPHYASEINLRVLPFLASLAESLTRGILLFADYGYGEQEYYHPERKSGTLTCFFKHHHYDNPLIFPGLQDMTAHVNFTSIVDCAIQKGCTLQGYTSQAAFLLNCGLINIATVKEKELNKIDEFKLHQAIKQLILPDSMGERVKILALGKNLSHKTTSLLGFKNTDKSRELLAKDCEM